MQINVSFLLWPKILKSCCSVLILGIEFSSLLGGFYHHQSEMTGPEELTEHYNVKHADVLNAVAI